VISFRRIAPAVVAMAKFLSAQGLAAAGAEQVEVAKPVVVEYVQGKPKRSDSLGTTSYEPSEKERPFFKRLAKAEVTTGGLAAHASVGRALFLATSANSR
jgi:hypothetical protein